MGFRALAFSGRLNVARKWSQLRCDLHTTGYVAYIPKDNWFVQLQHLYSRVQGTSFAALVWNCGNYGLFPSCSTKDSCKGMHGVKRHQEGDPTLDRNKPKTDITPRLRDPSLGH